MASMIRGQAQEMPAAPPAQRNTPTGQPTGPILHIRPKMPLLRSLKIFFGCGYKYFAPMALPATSIYPIGVSSLDGG